MSLPTVELASSKIDEILTIMVLQNLTSCSFLIWPTVSKVIGGSGGGVGRKPLIL